MPDPNGALAVNDQTSDDILHYSVEILSKGLPTRILQRFRQSVEP